MLFHKYTVLFLAIPLLSIYCGPSDSKSMICQEGYLLYEGVCYFDADNDGIPDISDNCPAVANHDQKDDNQDGVGNACSMLDTDEDTIPDGRDNCPFTSNVNQADSDTDGIGDVCEQSTGDQDNDGVLDHDDNCPYIFNPDQADQDQDQTGDRCEDSDEDGILNALDNCPQVANETQGDYDQDGIGDACEDADSDGVPDMDDNCPYDANPDQADFDSNGIGDSCDPYADDLDKDGIENHLDNCPEVANPAQTDLDGDSEGDACEFQNGTSQYPFIISAPLKTGSYNDERNTAQALSDEFDSYPPNTLDESGPEYIYTFKLTKTANIEAWIDFPEPEGVDIDIHLLSSISPLVLITRGHHEINARLEPGIYYISMDTYVENGKALIGNYSLHVQFDAWQSGTATEIIPLASTVETPVAIPSVYVDERSTNNAVSDQFDSYPPNSLDESGPEFIYGFTLDQAALFSAEIESPEPSGVDIDVHLLSSLQPTLLARGHHRVFTVLQPGTYYLSLDTYVNNGDEMKGSYILNVSFRPRYPNEQELFNSYIMDAVDYLYASYKLLGYNINGVLTHDMQYGNQGTIYRTYESETMCVAAALEVMLTAMQLYEDETADSNVWEHLPINSWVNRGQKDIRGHIWVNYDIDSHGSADALRHFGMGMNVPFEELKAGSFINLNRTTGTGHAVVFIAYIDNEGNDYANYHDDVIGFKYFSSQGTSGVGNGGLDYRYAIFSEHSNPAPEMPYKRDLEVIRSEDQTVLNCGQMHHPTRWLKTSWQQGALRTMRSGPIPPITEFDGEYYNGVTYDD